MSMRFLKSLAQVGVLAVFGAASVACSAATESSADYQLGTQYKQVREVQKPTDPKRITVEEFFWYGCPHCFHLDPEIAAWLPKKGGDVDFTRIPNTLGRPEGEVHARAFYVAQTLGIGEKIHKPLFDAIHIQHYPMNTLDSIRALFVEVAGIKPADFDGVATSFVVDSGLRRAELAARAYGITAVPAIVVGGKYLVNAQPQDTMKVVDFVIEKIRKERKG